MDAWSPKVTSTEMDGGAAGSPCHRRGGLPEAVTGHAKKYQGPNPAAAHTVCDPEAGACAPVPHTTSFMPVTMGVVSRMCYLRPVEFISLQPSANTAIPLIGQLL